MKRQQRWSQASDEGPGHRVSPSGPFRRRRAMRHLDSLAQHPARQLSPDAAVAHVRVLGENGESEAPSPGVRNGPAVVERMIQDEAALERDGDEPQNASDRLRAVPIDEPLGDALRSTARHA